MKGYDWLENEDLNRQAEARHLIFVPELNDVLKNWHGENLLRYVARFASYTGNLQLVKFVVKNGLDVNVALGVGQTMLARTRSRDCQRFLIDVGAETNYVELLEETIQFIKSRNLARSYAILVMYAMYKMDKTYKNVSVIIGRVIWASRSDSENWVDWLN